MSKEFTTDSAGDYPTGETLKAIIEWPTYDFTGLLNFIKIYFERHGRVYEGTTDADDEPVICLATGGWSGNEDVIRAMLDNRVLWALHWYSSRRGGLYKFTL